MVRRRTVAGGTCTDGGKGREADAVQAGSCGHPAVDEAAVHILELGAAAEVRERGDRPQIRRVTGWARTNPFVCGVTACSRAVLIALERSGAGDIERRVSRQPGSHWLAAWRQDGRRGRGATSSSP
ncbi:unnamed protein product [Urochloa humidicola]